MESLTSTTIFHHSSPRHFLPSHLLSYPFANENLSDLSLPSFSGQVWDLADNIRQQGRDLPAANGESNAIVLNNTQFEASNEMARLINLILQPPSHKRGSSSLSNLETFTAAPSSSTTSATLTRERPQHSNTALNMLPYTQGDLKHAMEEVKVLFGKRQYKKCSIRCKTILANAKHPYQFHPLYTIYLCFYTASSLEQTARSLHNNSDDKLPFFQEAISYYQKAESSVSSASFTTEPKIIRRTGHNSKHHSKSSISSSNRSSIDSIFSQASSAASDSSSRPPSLRENDCKDHQQNTSSTSSIGMKPAPLRIQKKVSFSHQLPTLISQTEILLEDSSDSELIDCFPAPPSPSRFLSLETERQRGSEQENDAVTYQQSLALNRYQNHLSTFSSQLQYHVASINTQIALLSTSNTKQHSRNDFSNGGGEENGLGIGGIVDIEKEDIRRVELQERIKRLKERGWERRRFDAGRYQMLCDRALGEVEGCY